MRFAAHVISESDSFQEIDKILIQLYLLNQFANNISKKRLLPYFPSYITIQIYLRQEIKFSLKKRKYNLQSAYCAI